MAKYEARFRELQISAATRVLTGDAGIPDVGRDRLRACVKVRATVPSSGGDPKIEILGAMWGEITGHDVLEVAQVAEKEALRLLREDQLVTKVQLLAAGDWHIAWCHEQTGYLASPSLDVRVAFSLDDGRVQDLYGCLIKSGGRYVRFRSLRKWKWMERMVRRTLVRLAVRASRKPHATDGELDEAA